MADVFVSYARSDKARVAPLVAAIEARSALQCDDRGRRGTRRGRECRELFAAALSATPDWPLKRCAVYR